ncbi:MAG TPA: hypothetical protein VGC18_10960 [Lacisediminihabitans sp.]|uniref:hypothetical protein n=1 Tax=Lacisediminihabitans sp. TaxID=2787631 RepID=UPI002ED98566
MAISVRRMWSRFTSIAGLGFLLAIRVRPKLNGVEIDGRFRYYVGPQALQPLFSTFWSSGGWRRPPVMPGEPVFSSAVRDGVMFRESPRRGHDEWVSEIRRMVQQRLTVAQIEVAFVASLGSRRLDLRSALSSFAVARVLPRHAFLAAEGRSGCAVCGLLEGDSATDLNVLSFERFKWGGVRRTNLHYVHFDLDQFARAPSLSMGESDLETAAHLISVLSAADAIETSTSVEKRLSFLPSTQAERLTLVDILGVAGVLAPRDHPGFAREFVSVVKRDQPPRHFVDRSYPVSWWKGSDGVDAEVVSEMLPNTAARKFSL